MRMVDIIEKKRDGYALSDKEIEYVIKGYTNNDIPDYQVSALLMAIYFNGMTDEESTTLTLAMLKSGDTIDLSSIAGIKVDKHSTGGVGDKTTLVLGPLVASAGAKVAKLSGRGLGHTGGTLDKLESIPGLHIDIDIDQFIDQVNDLGIAVAGQTANLTPADKLLYALRDVTATVPSIPLIASSIMSKKLASGSDVIVLDVKVGDGAFMKTIDEAKKLSQLMVNIGNNLGRKVVAFITDMSQPLGYAVGNRLEVLEALDTLKGNGPDDLTELSLEIGAHMIHLADIAPTLKEARTLIEQQIKNNQAHQKQLDLFKAQGGTLPSLDDFIDVKEVLEVKASNTGYIKAIHALTIGLSAMKLGAGRQTKDDIIDPNVGIVLQKKVGDTVKKGDVLAKVYNNLDNISDILSDIKEAFEITQEPVEKQPIIFEIVR